MSPLLDKNTKISGNTTRWEPMTHHMKRCFSKKQAFNVVLNVCRYLNEMQILINYIMILYNVENKNASYTWKPDSHEKLNLNVIKQRMPVRQELDTLKH